MSEGASYNFCGLENREAEAGELADLQRSAKNLARNWGTPFTAAPFDRLRGANGTLICNRHRTADDPASCQARPLPRWGLCRPIRCPQVALDAPVAQPRRSLLRLFEIS